MLSVPKPIGIILNDIFSIRSNKICKSQAMRTFTEIFWISMLCKQYAA